MVDFSYVAELWGIVTKSVEYLGHVLAEDVTEKMKSDQATRNIGLRILAIGLSILGTTFFFLMRSWAFFKNKMARKLADPEELWKRRASQLQEDIYQCRVRKNSIPVLTIANFKGGSGKTMLAANLAAYFDLIGAKVLLIDFDAHGSLSDLVGFKNGKMIGKSAFLLERQRALAKILPNEVSSLDVDRGFQNTSIYDADKGLSGSENALLLEWIAGQKIRSSSDKKGMRYRFFGWFNFRKRVSDYRWRWWHRGQLDLRFNTFNYLKEKEIQDNFDLVIIDTPSQLTPSFVNAFCATTHLLIPTTADKVSVETTIQSTDVFQNLKDALRLEFRTLSIVPTLVQKSDVFVTREQSALRYLAENMNLKLRKAIIQGDLQSLSKNKRKKYLADLGDEAQNFKGVIWGNRKVQHVAGILDEEEGDLIFHHRQPAKRARIRSMFSNLGEWLIEEFEGEKGGSLFDKLNAYNKKQASVMPQPSGASSQSVPLVESANETITPDKTG